MNRNLSLILMGVVGVACSSQGDPHSDSAQASQSGSLFQVPFASASEFNAVKTLTGDAVGTSFSGSYVVTFDGTLYSSDCQADFVKGTDFFIDKGLSVEEIDAVLKNGGSPHPHQFTIQQEEGKITLLGEGDDETNISGAIYKDGYFVVTQGVFIGENAYDFYMISGCITDNSISIVRQGFIKIEGSNAAKNGSCGIFDYGEGVK